MAHFQIFIPGDKPKAEAFAGVGLRHLLAESTNGKPVPSGPSGESGTVYGWFTVKGVVYEKFDPKSQVWIPAIADGDELPAARYHVGFDAMRPPTPEDLERPGQYPGQLVTLGDNRQWRVPFAARLPYEMVRQDDGSTAYIPQRHLLRFSNQAHDWKLFFKEARPGGHASLEALRDFVELGLNASYRLTPEACDYLRLWSSGDGGTVLRAALAILTPDRDEVRP